MRTLTRIRQLAKGEFQVQLAHLADHKKRACAQWRDGPSFGTEREAELWARDIADSHKDIGLPNGRRGDPWAIEFPIASTRYWRWPTHSCRVRLI